MHASQVLPLPELGSTVGFCVYALSDFGRLGVAGAARTACSGHILGLAQTSDRIAFRACNPVELPYTVSYR